MATWDTVLALARELPQVEESTSYGTPALKVKGRLFARLREDGQSVVLWVADGEKEPLLAAEPAALFTTPHYDGHPTVLVRLPVVDDALLADLVTASWRLRAPVRVRRAWETAGDGGGGAR